MNVKHMVTMLAAPAALATAAPVAAAPFISFEMTGAVQGQFRIPTAELTTPDEVADDYFVIEDLTGTINGRFVRLPSVTFNTEAWDGGLTAELLNGEFIGLLGAQLFTGTTASPVFRFGTFALASDIDGATVNVTISQGVPEPATWALMILGFGATAGAMRRRAATRATVRFA